MAERYQGVVPTFARGPEIASPDPGLASLPSASTAHRLARSDNVGIYFAVARTKTGRAAAATLTTWSQAILIAWKKLGAELMDNTPLFFSSLPEAASRSAARARPANGAATMAAAGTSRQGPTARAR
jgi:hypothetical protein